MSVEVKVTVVVVGAVEVFELVLLLELDGAVDATLESVSVEEAVVLLGALLAVFVEEEDEGLADTVVVEEEDGDDVFELVLLFELVGVVDATLESVSVEEVDVLLGALLAVFVEEEDEGLADAVVVGEVEDLVLVEETAATSEPLVEEVDVLLGVLLAVFVEEEDEGLVDAVVVEEDGDDVFELVLLVFAEETSFFKDAWSDLYSLTFFAISLTRATLSVTSFLISDRIVLMVAISFFKSAFSVLMVFLSAVISALLSSLSFMFDFRSASSFFRLSRILSALLIAR